MARLGVFDIGQGVGDARDIGGGTALQAANQFVRIQTSGLRELVDELYDLAASAAPSVLRGILERGAVPVEQTYAGLARQQMATGNLADSVTHKFKAYDRAAVMIVGPRQTGNAGSKANAASGNHAWLVEFGSGPRSPGSNNRRKYVNVHRSINRRMRRAGSMNDTQFRNAGRGYYFLMGSINEPTRQGGGKAGYSRDFMLGADGRSGKQHPITLHPGEELAPMPGYHLMERTIAQTHAQVLSIMTSGLQREIGRR